MHSAWGGGWGAGNLFSLKWIKKRFQFILIPLIQRFFSDSGPKAAFIKSYRIYSKYEEGQAWSNSIDPDQTFFFNFYDKYGKECPIIDDLCSTFA